MVNKGSSNPTRGRFEWDTFAPEPGSKKRGRGRRRSPPPGHLPRTDLDTESSSSKAYTEGRTVGYRNRINGPVAPVKTITLDELPPESVLRQ